MTPIPNQIKARLAEKGIKQSDLARTLGVSRNNIGRAINHRHQPPPLIRKILDLLDLEMTVQEKRK